MTEESLFDLIIHSSESDRPAILDRETAGQPELRQRVERLAAAHDRRMQGTETRSLSDPHVVHTNSDEITGSTRRNDDHLAGTLIAGKYKLLERIGEGGMGDVWLAQQTEPVKRQVAVKLIKAGMDSKQVLARFEAERQALAMMDHPNIAKVLDGGVAEIRNAEFGMRNGNQKPDLIPNSEFRVPHFLPYFVMELVKGVPITEYCDQHKLTPKQRLELFVPVCQAIQHAHQKGVIHRDIKPSNVLIAMYDDRPVPKVIDFGVAKATGATLTEHTLNTGFGGIVGTPQYMSPEQATFNNLDIDTRSDVYSLGVLLYELLTGSPPFAKKELEKKGLLEILRVVREEEPPKPSTKLSTADALASLSASRGTEPKKLTGILRNELDWIVMKSLEKDRARRYETANGFAADVNRYLTGEPVQAHPPSAGYRFRTFVRRNRGQVIAASLVLFALLAGITGTTIGLFEAKRHERIAVAAAREESMAKSREAERAEGERLAKLDANAKREDAERNLAFAKKGNEILGSVFAGLNPSKIAESGRPLQDLLRENLIEAVKELEGSAVGDPIDVAGMQVTLAESLRALGEARMAVEVFQKARGTVKASFEPDHRYAIRCMNGLALSYQDAGEIDKALPLFEEAVRIMKAKSGPDHPETLVFMSNLAAGYLGAKKFDEAKALLEETLRLMKAIHKRGHPDLLSCMNNLAVTYEAIGQVDKAITLLEETLRLTRARYGPDHPETLTSMNNLANAYLADKQSDKALPLYLETLELTKQLYGPDHPATLLSMSNLERFPE
jgi:serine/threonine protein kinase/tetratricopeptide (TPR) repeat protein